MALSTAEATRFRELEREITRLWDMFPKNAKRSSFKGHVHGVSGGTGDHSHAHGDMTGVSSGQHHALAHTVASHSDTTATGAELETLTGGGEITLHSHAANTEMLRRFGVLTLFEDYSPGFVFEP